jgi:beta-galactosidase
MFIGTQYYRQPNPPQDDWERDLEHIRQLGLKVVRLWIPWSYVQPGPGEWELGACDRFFELTASKGLKVLAQLTAECAPYWVHARYPEAAFRDLEGNLLPNTPYASGYLTVGGHPGLCYDTPVGRELAEKYMRTLVTRYASFDHLYAWDVWNELNPLTRMGQYEWCGCPHTMRLWRSWLADKYGDIGTLNALWQRNFKSFEEVPFIPVTHYTERIDQAEFAQHRLREWMRWRTEVVRDADPNPEHLLVSHHHGGSYGVGYITDDWMVTDLLDVWGTSIYRRDLYEVSRKFDWTRSAAHGRPWWLSEVSGGRGMEGGAYFYLSDDVKSAAETRTYPLLAFSHGAEATVYWQFRCESFGEESPNFGLTNQAGDPTERTEAASQLAGMLERHAEVFEALRFPQSPVALLWEPRAFTMERVSYWERDREPIGVLNLAGYHRALTAAGHQVDILHTRDVAEHGVPAPVRLLIHPYGVIDRPGLADAVTRWVEQGGVFVASPVTGHYRANGYASPRVPTDPWRRLLGVQQTGLRYPTSATPSTTFFSLDLLETALTAEIGTLEATRLAEAYTLDDDVVPLAVLGSDVVATARSVGSGQALACGTFLGAAFEYRAQERQGLPPLANSLLTLLGRLAGEAAARPPITVTGDAFCRTGHVADAEQLVSFVHNPTELPLTTWVCAPGLIDDRQVTDLVSDSGVGSLGPVRPLRIEIPARDTRVLLIGN